MLDCAILCLLLAIDEGRGRRRQTERNKRLIVSPFRISCLFYFVFLVLVFCILYFSAINGGRGVEDKAAGEKQMRYCFPLWDFLEVSFLFIFSIFFEISSRFSFILYVPFSLGYP